MRLIQIVRSVVMVLRARAINQREARFELARQCQELGGVYIKFLQMLAVHHNTKNIVEGMGLEAAFEQVAYEPIDLRRELGPVAANLVHIEQMPFAAGSYGQVYRARLGDGRQVIVKILRPTVRAHLRTDLAVLRLTATVAGWFTPRLMLDIRDIAREFSQATWAETNYLLEANSGERLRRYFAERGGVVVIPVTFTDMSSRTVLVQEYVGGVSLAAATMRQLQGEPIDEVVRQEVGSDIWVQLRTLGTELLRASVYADCIMVDPHPGNIRLLPDDRVALIDFGLISPAPTNREAFAGIIHEFRLLYEDNFQAGTFLAAMLAFFDTELHDALLVVARGRSRDYQLSLSGFAERFAADQTHGTALQHYLNDRRMMQVFMDLLNRDNRLGLRVAEENAMLQRSMMMYISIVRSLGEAHDGSVHFAVLHACLDAVDREIAATGISQSPQHRAMTDVRALEVVTNWLATLAERDRGLYEYVVKGALAPPRAVS